MELLGVIQCLGHIIAHYGNSCFIHIYTDSEHVTNLLERRKKLESAQFLTKKGTPVAHAELIKQFYRILDRLSFKIERVSSHQKEGVSEISDFNREVDKLSRKILRKEIRNQ
jgi:ribonuclease HI